MNEKLDNIPYHELSGMFELIRKIQLVVEHFEKKGIKIPKENIKLFTDSEIVLIWLRSLKTRFKKKVWTLSKM